VLFALFCGHINVVKDGKDSYDAKDILKAYKKN
jgi:hypothetical protein